MKRNKQECAEYPDYEKCICTFIDGIIKTTIGVGNRWKAGENKGTKELKKLLKTFENMSTEEYLDLYNKIDRKEKQMNITETIYNKYPKVWEKLKEKFNPYTIIDIMQPYIFFQKGTVIINCNDCDCKFEMMPSMLYGLLVDFFDKNNIIIQIQYNSHDEDWSYDIVGYQSIWYLKDFEGINQGQYFSSRQQTLENAILKACEIFKDRLKDSNNE